MGDPILKVELRWKRKGGRAVAEAAGAVFRVDDDGAFAVRLPTGAWEHGRAVDAAAAKEACAGLAQDLGAVRAGEVAELVQRRQEAANLAAIPRRDRRWVDALVGLLLHVTHDGIAPGFIAGRMAAGGNRALFEQLCADAEVMGAVRGRPRAEAQAHLERCLLAAVAAVDLFEE